MVHGSNDACPKSSLGGGSSNSKHSSASTEEQAVADRDASLVAVLGALEDGQVAVAGDLVATRAGPDTYHPIKALKVLPPFSRCGVVELFQTTTRTLLLQSTSYLTPTNRWYLSHACRSLSISITTPVNQQLIQQLPGTTYHMIWLFMIHMYSSSIVPLKCRRSHKTPHPLDHFFFPSYKDISVVSVSP